VPEAETNVSWLALCAAVVRALTFPCDLMPLKDVVLQIIDRVGGKRERDFGLKVVNQCFCYGLLELELMRPDGTTTVFSKTNCEHLTVCAAPDPAEAVWVDPREDGRYFARRAGLVEPTSPAMPAMSVDPAPAENAAVPVTNTEVPVAEPEPAARVEESISESTQAVESKPLRVESIPPPEPTPAADVGNEAGTIAAAAKEDDFLPASEVTRPKRGRRTKVTPELERYIFKLLDFHGLPRPDDPDWSSQADVEKILQDRADLGETQAREHAHRLIDTWKAGKAEKAGN
jgi:hypothetical protein